MKSGPSRVNAPGENLKTGLLGRSVPAGGRGLAGLGPGVRAGLHWTETGPNHHKLVPTITKGVVSGTKN